MGMTSNMEIVIILQKLLDNRILTKEEFAYLIDHRDDSIPKLVNGKIAMESPRSILQKRANEIRQSVFGNKIYTRGLIEFTNYCKNNCYYCGIRAGNRNAERYRLTEDEIMDCCQTGYELGFRTFVLQGGEDPYFTDERIAQIVRNIKSIYSDCAVTLSVGEHEIETYRLWKEAGADRYLLRHETANDEHYRILHPEEMSASHRRQCLWNLKSLGYQTGAGFMVGSPGQTSAELAEDLLFLNNLRPEMIGIGPFIHHDQTPFASRPDGTKELTLFLLSILRVMFPKVLLPSTTALGTIAADGREQGILHGANVVMPNLSPVADRKKYSLYEHKICTGEEAAECRSCLANRMHLIGCELAVDRGDYQAS